MKSRNDCIPTSRVSLMSLDALVNERKVRCAGRESGVHRSVLGFNLAGEARQAVKQVGLVVALRALRMAAAREARSRSACASSPAAECAAGSPSNAARRYVSISSRR